ncbi:hypothetical protein OG21DRAFT_1605541 [Imleria badia]|nr:hypothetical protein OG21DRAFT_1605541 [Imleria badia]
MAPGPAQAAIQPVPVYDHMSAMERGGPSRSPLVLQTFAAHFNFIQGRVKVSALEKELCSPRAALALACTATETNQCIVWSVSVEKGPNFEFNEIVWGDKTRGYLDPIRELCDENLSPTVSDTQNLTFGAAKPNTARKGETLREGGDTGQRQLPSYAMGRDKPELLYSTCRTTPAFPGLDPCHSYPQTSRDVALRHHVRTSGANKKPLTSIRHFHLGATVSPRYGSQSVVVPSVAGDLNGIDESEGIHVSSTIITCTYNWIYGSIPTVFIPNPQNTIEVVQTTKSNSLVVVSAFLEEYSGYFCTSHRCSPLARIRGFRDYWSSVGMLAQGGIISRA